MRTESDSMGSIEVPDNVYWGAQTARALEHFHIGTEVMHPQLIRAFALLKKSCDMVNLDLGRLPGEKARLIIQAAEEILTGKLSNQFPLSIWQSGSGTQTNMNVNEVISNRAIELAGGKLGSKTPIHPNDDVNLSQSTNDAFPTAMYIAAATSIRHQLMPPLRQLRHALTAKSWEYTKIVKIGRTHMQDATPLTVGQEFSGWASLLQRDRIRLDHALDNLYDLAIGGTAVGTGLNAHPEFAERTACKIAELTHLPFRSHPNKFAALSAHDELAYAHGVLATLAGSLMKIANDIRLMASGPRCGLGELRIPENEPGSSIMPGKVNPTQCEAMTMVAVQVHGNDCAIRLAASQGHLQLNVYKPLLIHCFLQSVTLLGDACKSFHDHLITGLQINRDRLAQIVNQSLMLVTALAPKIGYDKAAKIARQAYQENTTLRQACEKLGYLNMEEFDQLINPASMIHPG